MNYQIVLVCWKDDGCDGILYLYILVGWLGSLINFPSRQGNFNFIDSRSDWFDYFWLFEFFWGYVKEEYIP